VIKAYPSIFDRAFRTNKHLDKLNMKSKIYSVPKDNKPKRGRNHERKLSISSILIEHFERKRSKGMNGHLVVTINYVLLYINTILPRTISLIYLAPPSISKAQRNVW